MNQTFWGILGVVGSIVIGLIGSYIRTGIDFLWSKFSVKRKIKYNNKKREYDNLVINIARDKISYGIYCSILNLLLLKIILFLTISCFVMISFSSLGGVYYPIFGQIFSMVLCLLILPDLIIRYNRLSNAMSDASSQEYIDKITQNTHDNSAKKQESDNNAQKVAPENSADK